MNAEFIHLLMIFCCYWWYFFVAVIYWNFDNYFSFKEKQCICWSDLMTDQHYRYRKQMNNLKVNIFEMAIKYLVQYKIFFIAIIFKNMGPFQIWSSIRRSSQKMIRSEIRPISNTKPQNLKFSLGRISGKKLKSAF